VERVREADVSRRQECERVLGSRENEDGSPLYVFVVEH